MNFFKKLFGRDEEVSLKPAIGKASKPKTSAGLSHKENNRVSEDSKMTESFASQVAGLSKREMTNLAQVLRNLAEQQAADRQIQRQAFEKTEGTTQRNAERDVEMDAVGAVVTSTTTDFSGVASVEEALNWVAEGTLEPLYLVGVRFGGSSKMNNTVFVPLGIAKIKDHLDDLLEELVDDGRKISFQCQPTYKGGSFVPSTLRVEATDSETGLLILSEQIAIW